MIPSGGEASAASAMMEFLMAAEDRRTRNCHRGLDSPNQYEAQEPGPRTSRRWRIATMSILCSRVGTKKRILAGTINGAGEVFVD